MIIKKVFYKIIKKINKIWYAKILGVKLGENVRLIGNLNLGTEPYLISIGNHVTVSNDVSFVTHDGATWIFKENRKYKDVVKYGKIKIGNNCFIGTKSILLPGVEIGDNSIVAAGSVVTKKFPSGVVIGGNPAKVIKSTKEFTQKCVENNKDYDIKNYRKNKKEEVLKMLREDK